MFRHRVLRTIGFIMFVLILFVTVAPVFAAPISVNTLADENGTNSAACSLREAVRAAERDQAYGGCPRGQGPSDTITFIGAALSGTITLGSPITYDGQTYNGGNVIIDGNGTSNTTISGGDTTRIFRFILANNSDVTLQNMTISGGSAGAGNGGAILATAGAVNTSYVNFTGNTAANGGAIAVASTGTTFNFFATNFTTNTATNGGALYNNVSNTKFWFEVQTKSGIEWQLNNNDAADGGGVWISAGELRMEGLFQFSNNGATSEGGALYATGDAYIEVSGGTQVRGDAGATFGLVQNNTADNGSAVFWDSSASNSSFSDVCFGNNNGFSVYATVGHKLDALSNYWASPWGPRIWAATLAWNQAGNQTCVNGTFATTFCTAAAVSSGETITGFGDPSTNQSGTDAPAGAGGGVNVSLNGQTPVAWGDGRDNNPSLQASFLTTAPRAGCQTCVNPSGVSSEPCL